ncbi:S-adenosyl-L-methionine-dependent methyltransferase [Cyberlindnera jadinii NRRL Y-1542]|uniref:sphingolipid C(9)-methyltransferase n=1 Tax=Cyberlindnera jadinii (strain ATCC 18201 / CBS 1600 / BCRC 20928 / JCM 3617 / NBRC 0987 / NRRL Y-1542) TaxID=983966 RepID=A0A1E4S478_CYBJN|nr:S-adenosyl-L-methionine-dependent methyltransferase [Cyberlindnera jadinii NRRL Y-1542]ODV74328.1 S-adenosyl-L-methionine-dependent methyltransferase [Cyberlindnera jadinii NRRL Y-1542]
MTFLGYSFKPTPPLAEPQPKPSTEYGLRTTDYPAIKNAPLPADGPGSKHFSNLLVLALIAGIPWFIKSKLGGGFKTWVFFVLLTFLPILMVYWTLASTYSPRLNERVRFPNKGVEHYLEFHTEELKQKYSGQNKIPMETFHELYFANKVSFKGDALEIMEYRHDWAQFSFTLSLFKFFLLGMIPEVIMHTRSQDEEQVRDHYDRGDDFYTWFLGSRMIYTSGLISDITVEESLEQLQDNKLKVVCDKIDLQKGERLLDLGCGWGTLATYASKVYGASVTGITLGRNQTKWGNEKLKLQGIPEEQSKILCMDYRDTPVPEGKYNKITCLEMAEHVGIRKFGTFLQQVYDMLDDDGLFFLQYAGLRKSWQYEDLIWGLFMNKYIFPGADASTPLDFVVSKLEATGFETVSIDNIGVDYSATLWRWYRNWMSNKDSVVNKYGVRWFRIWEYFLAYSTIISRQGSATCYQIVLRKNLNSYHRIEYVPKQKGLLGPIKEGVEEWFK